MKYPEYVKVNDRTYKIRTDFRIALRCNNIATDDSIGDYERALAIIYLLFENGLDHQEDYEKLLELATKYLSCGKEVTNPSNDEPDMDYNEDMDYIEASFMSDYHIDLANEKMHWWKFNKLMNGLSNSDMGNCCILNRIRNLRTYNTREIKDDKERAKIEKAKQQVALKRYKKENNLTKEQEESMRKLDEILKIGG